MRMGNSAPSLTLYPRLKCSKPNIYSLLCYWKAIPCLLLSFNAIESATTKNQFPPNTICMADMCHPVFLIPLKKGTMFFTSPLGLSVCVCVCVCVSVCHHVCGEMAGLSNMVSSEVNTIHKNLKMQH